MRGEVLGFLCQRATAQPDHHAEQGDAVNCVGSRSNWPNRRPVYREQASATRSHAGCPAHFVAELVRYQLEQREARWRLQFDFDHAAWPHLLAHRLGRTVLLTNRMDWTAEQVVAGYSGQQQIEQCVPRTQGRRLAGLGTDVSLDRQQDSRPCLLLHARNLAAAVHSQAGPAPSGRDCRWNNCSKNSARSSSSSCSIRPRATKVPIASPPCSPSRPSPQQASPKRSASINSVVPHVGNTRCGVATRSVRTRSSPLAVPSQ